MWMIATHAVDYGYCGTGGHMQDLDLRADARPGRGKVCRLRLVRH